MIEKIIEISNIGHFVAYQFQGSSEWNGQFSKLNIIYAPNGSGKTTLATLFKSLSQNDVDLIRFKKTFGVTSEPSVKIKSSLGLIQLKDLKWTSNNLKLEVFDINYIEDYLFAGSFLRKQNKTNLYRLLFGETGAQLRNKMMPIIKKIEILKKKRSSERKNPEINKQIKEFQENLNNLLLEFESYTVPIYQRHIELVNKYLQKFTSYITLKEFSFLQNASVSERFRIYPIFMVYEEQVAFNPPNLNSKIGNARYSMSEGDKSTIALCFFLARLELSGIEDKIIIFDDPLSSFDYSRRNATIYQLAKIANNSVQFFLLTHDLAFAADFADKCAFLEQTNMKIYNIAGSSSIKKFNFSSEFLTSTQKDIETIKRFNNIGALTDTEKRDVIRCIRPVLEGVFKSKYFDIIPNNKWLGDIIEVIKSTNERDRLYRLKSFVDDIVELNDFTKSYHHSTGNIRDLSIDDNELKNYIKLLMETIDKI